MQGGKVDSVSIAGVAIFSALAILLSAASQAVGLFFPVVPYLQFDLGEIAVLMAFYIFGPVPAVASSFVEFVGLEAYGRNAPVGPLLKLGALLSTVGGLWLGTAMASRLSRFSVRRLVLTGASVGILARVGVMTVANYYLVVYLYGLGNTMSIFNLAQAFSLVGLNLTEGNALALILIFTGVFNALQLAFVVALSYTVLRFPPVSNLKVGGRGPWFASIVVHRNREGALPASR
jgi:riboflavin transporter FmnP